jgi:broad specificity phosphatase PhoE
MQKEWPQYDWSTVDPTFPSKTGFYAYTIEALTKRGLEARKWLKARPEKVIAVVSHSGFLRGPISNKKYAHADFRIFDFAPDGDDARLVEWEVTETNGGGLGRSQSGFWGFRRDIPLREEAPIEVIASSSGTELCILRKRL